MHLNPHFENMDLNIHICIMAQFLGSPEIADVAVNVDELWVKTSISIQNCLIEIKDSLSVIELNKTDAGKFDAAKITNSALNEIDFSNIEIIIDRIQSNLEKKVFVSHPHMSPTQFFTSFFHGLKAPALGHDSFRDMFEHIGPTSQCKYTENALKQIMASDKLRTYFTNWNICYICGLPINDGKTSDVGTGQEARECEHILPAFTALGHYGLVQSSCTMTPDDIDFYRLEYANAHRCCNRVKSDDLWITYNEMSGLYEVNIENIRETYNNIFKSDKHDCSSVKQAIEKSIKENKYTKDKWINDRIAFLKLAYLDRLCYKINDERRNKECAYHLAERCRQINALRVTADMIARALIGAPQLVQKPTEVSVTFKVACKRIYNVIGDEIINHYVQTILDFFIEQGNNNQTILSRIKAIFGVPVRARRAEPSIEDIIRKDTVEMANINDIIRSAIKTALLDKIQKLGPVESLTPDILTELQITETEIGIYIDQLIPQLKIAISDLAKIRADSEKQKGVAKKMGGAKQQRGGVRDILDNLIDQSIYEIPDKDNIDVINVYLGLEGIKEIVAATAFAPIKTIVTRSGRRLRKFIQFEIRSDGEKYVTIGEQVLKLIDDNRNPPYLLDAATGNKIQIEKHINGTYTYDDDSHSLRFGIYRGGGSALHNLMKKGVAKSSTSDSTIRRSTKSKRAKRRKYTFHKFVKKSRAKRTKPTRKKSRIL